MSFKEVKELRKSGKLDEALIMAKQDLDNDPINIWNKRSISWVYYDYLKQYSTLDNFVQFKEYLDALKSLKLPDDETMLFDNCAFQIGKIIYALQKSEPVEYSKINEIFELIEGFHFTKSAESYSFLYQAFHKGYKNWTNYIRFADWWGFDNFRSGDYLEEEFNGRKRMAIVEQAYIAYSKKILEGEVEDQSLNRQINKQKIIEFLPKLDNLIDKYPVYQYPPYFKAKLLLSLGDTENLMESFLPFAKKKRNDFWVWELMADVYPVNDNRRFACLCKALSLNTSDDFLINTRQKLAELLIREQNYNEARKEIDLIIKTREKNQWPLTAKLRNWIEQDWYSSATTSSNNSKLYDQYKKTAEEILYQDIEEETIAVEFVNTDKSMLNFVKDKTKHGFFKYADYIQKPKIGDIYKVRFNGDGKNGYFNILSAKRMNDEVQCDALTVFDGSVRIIHPHNFGFIDDVFIDKHHLLENNVQDNQLIKGRAILSFNKKKEEWGWKAFYIE